MTATQAGSATTDTWLNTTRASDDLSHNRSRDGFRTVTGRYRLSRTASEESDGSYWPYAGSTMQAEPSLWCELRCSCGKAGIGLKRGCLGLNCSRAATANGRLWAARLQEGRDPGAVPSFSYDVACPIYLGKAGLGRFEPKTAAKETQHRRDSKTRVSRPAPPGGRRLGLVCRRVSGDITSVCSASKRDNQRRVCQPRW